MSDFCLTCGNYDCECSESDATLRRDIVIVAKAVVVLAELAMSPPTFQMWVKQAGEDLVRVAYPATCERPVVTEFKEMKKLRDATGASAADCRKALLACEGDVFAALRMIRETGLA